MCTGCGDRWRAWTRMWRARRTREGCGQPDEAVIAPARREKFMSLETRPSAACAVHPSVPALATCERCGNYMCRECRATTRMELCEDCERHVGTFPLDRQSFDIGAAASYAWARYSDQWPLPTVVALLLFAVSYGIALAGGAIQVSLMRDAPGLAMTVYALSQLGSNLVTVMLMAIMLRMAVVATGGQILAVEHIWQGLRRVPQVFALHLSYVLLYAVLMAPALLMLLASEGNRGFDSELGAMIGLGTAFVLFPALVYVLLGVGNATVELVLDPDVSIVNAVQRSWTVAQGYRWQMVAAVLLSSLATFAGVLLCCVGALPAWAFTMFLWATTYQGLRAGLLPTPTGRFPPSTGRYDSSN